MDLEFLIILQFGNWVRQVSKIVNPFSPKKNWSIAPLVHKNEVHSGFFQLTDVNFCVYFVSDRYQQSFYSWPDAAPENQLPAAFSVFFSPKWVVSDVFSIPNTTLCRFQLHHGFVQKKWPNSRNLEFFPSLLLLPTWVVLSNFSVWFGLFWQQFGSWTLSGRKIF